MISVIIPVYNEAAALPRLLAQLQPLRGRLEIIVVDGGSNDGSMALVAGLVDKVIVVPKGRAAQLNAGAAQASGSVLWFLHADTGFVTDVSDYLAVLDGAQGWGFFGVCLSGQRWIFRVIGQMVTWRSSLQGIGTGDQGLFVSTALFRKLGGYDGIPIMEDIALCKRLREIKRPQVLPLKLVTSSRRWQKYGVLKTVLLMWQLRLLYFLGVNPAQLAKRYR